MKKYLRYITLTVSSLLLAGCISYNSDPGYIKDVVGTYELQNYTYTPDDGDKIDFIKEKKAKSYIVVDSSGYGYTTYEDEDTPFYIDTTRIKFVYSSDEEGNPTDLVNELYYTRGLSKSSNDFSPKAGRLELGVNVKQKNLNMTAHNTKVVIGDIELGLKYTMHVTYKKVNAATDLAYLNKVYKTSFTLLPFEQKMFDNSWYRFDCASYDVNPYIYHYVKFDIKNNKLLRKFALKEDEKQVSEDNIPFNMSKGEEGYNFSYDDFSFSYPFFAEELISQGVLNRHISSTVRYYDMVEEKYVEEASAQTTEVYTSLSKYDNSDEEIEEFIASDYQYYQDSKL